MTSIYISQPSAGIESQRQNQSLHRNQDGSNSNHKNGSNESSSTELSPTSTPAGEKNNEIGVNEESCAADNNSTTTASNATPTTYPQAFLCPITMEVMKDPVTDFDGNTYERENIMEWINNQRKLSSSSSSPITRNSIDRDHLVPNRTLQEMIYQFMGSEWADEAKKYIEEQASVNKEKMEKTDEEERKRYRRKVNEFLEDISRIVGRTVRVNDQGICAFTYEHLKIVIEVPETVGSFFLYCEYFDPAAEALTEEQALQRALRLNYLQQSTRGACLSLDKLTDKFMVSYVDRVDDINTTDFRNILENFIDTSLNLERELREASAPATPAETATETETASPTDETAATATATAAETATETSQHS